MHQNLIREIIVSRVSVEGSAESMVIMELNWLFAGLFASVKTLPLNVSCSENPFKLAELLESPSQVNCANFPLMGDPGTLKLKG